MQHLSFYFGVILHKIKIADWNMQKSWKLIKAIW